MAWSKGIGLLVSFVCMGFLQPAVAGAQSKTVEGVVGKGEAMIVGITDEQARLLALQRARADAIEQAAGISVLGSTLIKDGLMAGDFLKTFSSGFIVKEKVYPGGRMIPQTGGFPLANFTAEVVATVIIPERKVPAGFLLESTLDRLHIFQVTMRSSLQKYPKPHA